MKKLYLIYNQFSNGYLFSDRPNPYLDKGRVSFKEEELTKELKKLISLKKKSLLTLIDLNESAIKNVKNVFKDSKILIEIKSGKI